MRRLLWEMKLMRWRLKYTYHCKSSQAAEWLCEKLFHNQLSDAYLRGYSDSYFYTKTFEAERYNEGYDDGYRDAVIEFKEPNMVTTQYPELEQSQYHDVGGL